LAIFINEANLPKDVGTETKNITIEQVLQEKATFDLSLKFEKLGVQEKALGWRKPGKFLCRRERAPLLISFGSTKHTNGNDDDINPVKHS
jgi:hypothetical protein